MSHPASFESIKNRFVAFRTDCASCITFTITSKVQVPDPRRPQDIDGREPTSKSCKLCHCRAISIQHSSYSIELRGHWTWAARDRVQISLTSKILTQNHDLSCLNNFIFVFFKIISKPIRMFLSSLCNKIIQVLSPGLECPFPLSKLTHQSGSPNPASRDRTSDA